jgi:hypothetical protein
VATTIDSVSYSQPVYDLAYIHEQPANPHHTSRHTHLHSQSLTNQAAGGSDDKDAAVDGVLDQSGQPQSDIHHHQQEHGHGSAGDLQEFEPMAALEFHGVPPVADSAPVSSRPKRVRTGK